MAAALMESALDLSAKPLLDSKVASPAHSTASDLDSSRFDRTSSVSSDSEQEDAAPGMLSVGIRPSSRLLPPAWPGSSSDRRARSPPSSTPAALDFGGAGDVTNGGPSTPPPSHARPGTPTSSSPPGYTTDSSSPTASTNGLSPGGPVRPFKMYPFDSMPNMYSQLAAAAASQGVYQYGPTSPTSSMSMGLFDSGISLSSPIGQYLQQKKRRLDTRDPPAPGSGNTSPASSIDESLLIGPNGKKINPVPEEKKDDAYWERRRKNNEAAKRSRDARRAKEEEIALRAAFLEQENLKLRAQVAILKNETAKLHYMLYNRM